MAELFANDKVAENRVVMENSWKTERNMPRALGAKELTCSVIPGLKNCLGLSLLKM
jgi:hypothetical protein